MLQYIHENSPIKGTIFMELIFTSKERIDEIKSHLGERERLELKSYADKMMELTPLSVTYHESPAVSGDVHDYYSEGPYWWPDPENPDWPFIRRDGECFPGRFNHHYSDLCTLTEAVAVLSQAGVFLDEKKYHKKAMELIRGWFLDDETKMNPNLNHAQAIRGRCSGRGIGIIDTCILLRVVLGVNLIAYNGGFESEIVALKAWFQEYIHWLKTSENGIEEKTCHNNHANWYNTQLAAYSAFVGDFECVNECFEMFKNTIIPNQTGEDGSFTDEIQRTRSYHYTKYNLEASCILCMIAQQMGVDLWNAEMQGERGIKKSVMFFKPFYSNPFLWNYQQIDVQGAFDEDITMRMAAIQFDDAEIKAANEWRRAGKIPMRNMCHLGIVDLL